MRIFSVCLLVAILLGSGPATAYPHSAGLNAALMNEDKRPLEHEDYDRWNSISGTTLSADGEWVMYTVRDGKNNAVLKLRSTSSTKEYSIENATGARLTFDSKHVAYRIEPDKELLKKLKKEKKPANQLPKESFEILQLDTGKHFAFGSIKSFAVPQENGDWIAILLDKSKPDSNASENQSDVSETFEITPEGLRRPAKNQKKPKKSMPAKEARSKVAKKEKNESESLPAKADSKGKDEKEKKSGSTLVLKNLRTGIEKRVPNVVSFRFDKLGRLLAVATSNKTDGDQDGVNVMNLEDNSSTAVATGLGNYKNLAFNEKGTNLAFVTDRDDYDSKDSSWALHLWSKGQSQSKKIVAAEEAGVPDQWWLSSSSAPYFSENGKYLFYFTAPKPEDINEDDADEEPTAKLDLWHWQDPLLQPQQLIQANQEKNRSYVASYNLRTRKRVQIADKEMPTVIVDAKRNSDLAIGISDEKYKKAVSWDLPGFRDVFLVNLRTGDRELAMERVRTQPQMSPDGKFMVWWDTQSRNWFSVATKRLDEKHNLTEAIQFPLFNELHDTPSDPNAYGIAGWSEKDRSVLVYDRYDIWELDPAGKLPPRNATESFGRDNKIRFRYLNLDSNSRAVDASATMYLSAFDESSKDSGFFQMSLNDEKSESDDSEEDAVAVAGPSKILMLPERLSGLRKAKNSDRVVLTRSTFLRFPDIWASTLDFKKIHRISKVNPQQLEYAWGTVELTNWKATDGQSIDGLIYKPDYFDADKKYPMMVYFYERNSDNLHRHYVPAAGRSIINFSFYVSRGYVVFVPDIPYKTGEPGPSAANAILPGVDHMISQGYIDEKRIGTQGHSWGGYQTAYLVTQTDVFACAESGAPVSNMTSAYGGIRWGSGMSRMFQYEKTQSRIGDTLWNAREKYIANSPLFFVDKINTPLLILHNDQDGAVPWYQGIEMFVAMRRLEKPAWLLNYNGDPHWVMGRENRLDFAKRMQQFFDHYLKDGPMPKWMAEGIPAVDKGKEFGFETVEETESGESKVVKEAESEE